MTKKKKAEIVKLVRNALDGIGFFYDEREIGNGDVAFRMQFSGEMKKIDGYEVYFVVVGCMAQARAILPLTASEEDKGNVAEYLNMVNLDTVWAKCTMDANDGEIVCMCDAPLEYLTADPQESVITMVSLVADTWDKFGDGLVKVLMGNADPEDAFEEMVAKI